MYKLTATLTTGKNWVFYSQFTHDLQRIASGLDTSRYIIINADRLGPTGVFNNEPRSIYNEGV